jgi:predicted HTH domain antitoxin
LEVEAPRLVKYRIPTEALRTMKRAIPFLMGPPGDKSGRGDAYLSAAAQRRTIIHSPRKMPMSETNKSDTRAIRPTEVKDFVLARLYGSEEEVVQDALRHLLRARPEARVELAVHRYQSEELSLAKAAELAGVSWSQMRDILVEKGVPPRLGPETAEEAEEEAQVLRDFFAGQ